MTAILHYNVGNLGSVLNMFKRIGQPAILADTAESLEQADRLLLPGVGHFDHCMAEFRHSPLWQAVHHKVIDQGIPLLGICVGCQMLLEGSEEGAEPGLGWIKGRVVRFRFDNVQASTLKVPHMGWSELEPNPGTRLFEGMEEPRFYFVHSYYAQCADPETVAATADYGGPFTAAVAQENVMGVQFHPEKSHRFGMQLLSNFCQYYGV